MAFDGTEVIAGPDGAVCLSTSGSLPLVGAKETNKASGRNGASPASEAHRPRGNSKRAMILELIQRPTGATVKEIMTATGWQPHSVRGFMSTLNKNTGQYPTLPTPTLDTNAENLRMKYCSV
jgi:hypothetical protein